MSTAPTANTRGDSPTRPTGTKDATGASTGQGRGNRHFHSTPSSIARVDYLPLSVGRPDKVVPIN